MSFEERDRPGGIRQRFARVAPLAFEGSQPLAHRLGGVDPLPVAETAPGIFLSSWMIDSKHLRKFMKEVKQTANREVVLSLVLDTNVPGHPTVSMQLQEIFITKD